MKIDNEQAFALMFALFKARRNIHGRDNRADMTRETEAAARSLLMDLAEGRINDFSLIQPDVASTASGLLLDFLAKLKIDPRFVHRTWDVPGDLSDDKKALHIVRQELLRGEN